MRYPMTGIQKAYYIGRQVTDISTKIVYRVTIDKDLAKFEAALNQVISEQPALRIVFNENYEQEVLDKVPYYEIQEKDLRNLSETEREACLNDVFENMKRNRMDPGQWPLFSMTAYRTSSKGFVLLAEIDMLVADGMSFKILIKQIRKHYEAPDCSAPENTGFLEYVLKKSQKGEEYAKDLEFWKKKIDDFPEAPFLGKKSTYKQSVFSRKTLSIPKERMTEIEEMAKSRRVTSASYLLAAYAKVLSLYSGQKRFTLNLPVFDRTTEAEMSAVGDFTKIILLPVETGGKDIWTLCRDLQIATIEAMMHKHVDGTEIMEMVAAEKGKDKAFFPVVFTSMIYRNMDFRADIAGKLKGYSQTSNVYLDCQIYIDNDTLVVNWDYDTEVFNKDFISDMFDTFTGFLNGKTDRIAVNPELEKAVASYNETDNAGVPDGSLLALFLERVEETPENIAVSDSEKTWTYRELSDYARAAAAVFTGAGCAAGDKVMIPGHRRCETVGCILGACMFGGVFVPVDPDIPEERKAYIQELSGAFPVDDKVLSDISNEEKRFAPVPVSGDQEAYVIFTSGSTGRPKGVVITHGAAMNTICDVNNMFSVTERDVFLCVSSFSFDLSVYDVFGALSAGARIVLAEDNRDMEAMHKLISEQNVTILNLVPALMRIYTEYLQKKKRTVAEGSDQVISFDNREDLRIVFMSGDLIPPSLPNDIRKEYEQCRVWSGGGATECAIWSIFYPVPDPWDPNIPIPYGFPLSNQRLFVLDEEGALCPAGTLGEICIAGKGLAKGYYKDEKNTAESFVASPRFGRLYRTGDLGRFSKKGYIEFAGRKDKQVKINGNRVELGEIENTFQKMDEVLQCVVLLKKNNSGNPVLAAYFTGKDALSPAQIREKLGKSLPAYMIPTVMRQLESFPLTPNGKVNRNALEQLPFEPEDAKETEDLTRDETRIRDLLIQETGISGISVSDDIFETGVDSLKAIAFYNSLKLEYDVTLETIFRHHTIRGLAANLKRKEKEDVYQAIERIKRQAIFDNDDETAQKDLSEAYLRYLRSVEEEIPLIRERCCPENAMADRKVLLTGATGFIGAYLVKSIMEKTGYQVFCVVRGESGERRFWENARFYHGESFETEFAERIRVVSGDICAEGFGVEENLLEDLKRNTDIVFHCAAKVAHYGFEEDFQRINVEGTRNALEFCRESEKAKFIFLSTTRLLNGREDEAFHLFTEQTLPDECCAKELYAASKIDAEKLVRLYREKGVNANIIRVGTVVAEYETGKFQKNIEANSFYIVMKALFSLGMFPGIETEILDFSYVDYVADAILALSALYDCQNEVFHVFNYDKISETRLYGLLRESGMPAQIRLLDFDAYYDCIYEMYLRGENRALIDDILLHAGTYVSLDGEITAVGAERTRAVLKEFGFEWPGVTASYLGKMLAYGEKTGFFDFR